MPDLIFHQYLAANILYKNFKFNYIRISFLINGILETMKQPIEEIANVQINHIKL